MGTSICASVFGRVENPSSAALKKHFYSLLFLFFVSAPQNGDQTKTLQSNPSADSDSAGADVCFGGSDTNVLCFPLGSLYRKFFYTRSKLKRGDKKATLDFETGLPADEFTVCKLSCLETN